tara:strand:- start:3 stop:905 length:903 start_codon:yes stop_codon:yes gene_type:complete
MSEYKPTPIKSSPFKNEYLKGIAFGPLGFLADKMGVFDAETYDGKGSYQAINYQDKIDAGISALEGLSTENLAAGAINAFRGIENPFEDIKTDYSNQFENITNPYANIELDTQNVYEDLTVNRQAAEFAKQQSLQTQANIMQNLQGAAGGSGIAGLAQAMANQGQLQAQQASASIGQQEAANQRLAAQGAERIQQQQFALQQMQAKGTLDVDLAKAQGAQFADQMNQKALLEQASAQQQLSLAAAQGAMDQQRMQIEGAETARGIQYDKEQAMLQMYSGLQQSEDMLEQSSKSWWEKFVG